MARPVKNLPPRHTPFYGGTQISLPHSWPTIAPYTDAVAYSSRIRIQFDIYFDTILSASKCIKSIFFFFGYFNSKFVSIYHLSQASYARILCVIILYFIILKCLMNGTNWKVLITTYSSSSCRPAFSFSVFRSKCHMFSKYNKSTVKFPSHYDFRSHYNILTEYLCTVRTTDISPVNK